MAATWLRFCMQLTIMLASQQSVTGFTLHFIKVFIDIKPPSKINLEDIIAPFELRNVG